MALKRCKTRWRGKPCLRGETVADLDEYLRKKGNPSVPGAETMLFAKYVDRIKYVHLKDWDPTLPAEATGEGGTAVIRDFVELGEGRVDLRGCIDILRAHGYPGWITIELDYTRRTPYESVAMSKRYLVEELGLSV